MSLKPFWMVCRAPVHERSRTEPKARYQSREGALADARQLAEAQGAPFVVLCVDEVVRPGGAGTGNLFDRQST